jgi:DNA-binding CsgD family transcriptional regulator
VDVEVTVKRRRKLERIVAARTSEQRLVLRARIVLAAADGMANPAIAAELGCSVPTVRTWRERFARRGVPGIFDRPRCGRPPLYGPSARLAVRACQIFCGSSGQLYPFRYIDWLRC